MLQDAKTTENRFKSDLNEILKRKLGHKSNNMINLKQAKHKATKGEGLEIITPKQILTFVQVEAGNNSENLSNEIRQIVYFLYQSKELTKKVYNNIIKSIKI